MHKIKYTILGFLIGLGKIIPGVSGGMLAMVFGVYEDIIECIAHPLKIKTKLHKLVPLFIGIVLAIILGSNVMLFFLDYYYSESIAFFIGMMALGLFPIAKEIKKSKIRKNDILISSILMLIFIAFFLIDFTGTRNTLSNGFIREGISLLICGLLDAVSTIVPGISGTALLMLVGYYEVIMEAFANINIQVLIPYFIGFLFGIYYLSKLIDYLFKNHTNFMKISILGFATISLIMLFSTITITNIASLIKLILIFFIGVFISYILEYKLSSQK